ncbi:MAG: PEP/pyruvate-binding domain-containing protein [bacterium]|nr:PEP/pyruvate-binding domain-containing protein [bacterium]
MSEPNILLRVKLQTSILVVASLMVTVSALAMSFALGMMAVVAGYEAFGGRVRMAVASCSDAASCTASQLVTVNDFDRLAVPPPDPIQDLSILHQYRRGQAVACIVPKFPAAEEFCQPHENCLRTPLFLRVVEQADVLAALKQLYPEAFGGVSANQWHTMTGDPAQRVYYQCAVYRTKRAPDKYGFDYFRGDTFYAYGDIEVLPYDEVRYLHTALSGKIGFTAPLYYYPDALNTPQQLASRAWTDPSFPIFSEQLWTYDIRTEEELHSLISYDLRGDFNRLIAVVPIHPAVDDWCAGFAAQGIACPTQVIYASQDFGPWHFSVFVNAFPELAAALSTDPESPDNPQNLFGVGGKYIEASIWQGALDNFYRFSLFSRSGIFTYEQVKQAYDQLKATFVRGSQLVYVPTAGWFGNPDQLTEAKKWKDIAEFPIDFGDSECVDIPYEAYTIGTAYGTVRILTPATYEELHQTNGLSWQDFLVFEQAPFDVETPVAGTMTGTCQSTHASHLALRAARRNTPNAFVKDLTALRAKDGQLVKMTVREDGYDVASASLAEAQAWWNAHQPRLKPPQPTNQTYRGFDRVREMTDAPTSRFSRFGGKASNLAKLYAFLPSSQQVEAFGVPFSYFYDFMRTSTIVDTSSFPSQCRYAGVTYNDFIQRVLGSPTFMSSSAVRAKCLNAFYEYGRKYGTIDPTLALALKVRVATLWNASLTTGKTKDTGVNVQVRFRSSSNMEDGLEFNGAGLYESTTVCLPDQVDADTVATCDPAEDHEETIERALRKVWMSSFLPRAWEERGYYQLPQDRSAMALLVSTGIPDELANGVAFTGDPMKVQPLPMVPGQPFNKYYVVNAQWGEVSVVDPPAGTVAETTRLEYDSGRQSAVARLVRRSSLTGPDDPNDTILNSSNAQNFYNTLQMIDGQFPVALGPYKPEQVIFDLEFKYVGSAWWNQQLIIKQVRPFLIGEAVRYEGPSLPPAAPTGLTASEVKPDRVTLQWQASGSADALAVVDRRDNGVGDFRPYQTLTVDHTTFTDVQVLAGGSYEYRVRLEDSFGSSAPSAAITAAVPLPTFRRGDADAKGSVELTDVVYLLTDLFLTGPEPPCDDAADANDDGALDIGDPIRNLLYLFSVTVTEPPLPGPTTPGPDPTADPLGCAQYP